MIELQKRNNGGGQSYFRARNISLVINTINQHEPITKRDLVDKTGLSFAKINSIIHTLNENELTLENGKEESGGGRPSALYQINPNYRYIVGCELSHSRVHTIIGNLKGEILYNNSMEFEKFSSKDFVIQILIENIQSAIEELKITPKKLLGIGVAVAGLVNPKEGAARPFPHLADWGDLSIKLLLEEEFKITVHVENVANAAALAELNFGRGRGKKNLLFLDVGTGVGMGIILNGKLYAGVTGSAGEFGHITVDENGPICACGNVGCIETLASTKAVVRKAKDMIEQGVLSSLHELSSENIEKINFNLICEAANKGDKLSFNLLDDMGKNLGEGIVTIINLFNPEAIILGGEIDQDCGSVLDSIMNIVQKRALEIPRRATEILFSSLGDNVNVIGSTIPLIEKFFSTSTGELN